MYLVRDIMYCKPGKARAMDMKRQLFLAIALMVGGVAIAAQHTAAPKPTATTTNGDAAKIRKAMSAGPDDIAKHAAIMEMDEKGAMKHLRAGANGWTCMLVPAGPDVSDSMCMDKTWSAWADAYMAKKTPQVTSLGIAYMLGGDHGGSNTDPFAMKPTATNQWVVVPKHIMVLVPDPKMLDSLPTDPHAGGAWVMWKGTPYAHIMVPPLGRSCDEVIGEPDAHRRPEPLRRPSMLLLHSATRSVTTSGDPKTEDVL